MLLGLTGKFAAGKGAVADILRARGFAYHSLSDILREELAARGLAESREALTEMGNELRRLHGPGALAVRLVDRLRGGADHVVDSIRNPVEVEVLRTLDGFVLVGVDADPRVRFERLAARGRQGDVSTWERFVELEERETHSDDPTRQRLAATFELADLVLVNDGARDDLEAAVARLLDAHGSRC